MISRQLSSCTAFHGVELSRLLQKYLLSILSPAYLLTLNGFMVLSFLISFGLFL